MKRYSHQSRNFPAKSVYTVKEKPTKPSRVGRCRTQLTTREIVRREHVVSVQEFTGGTTTTSSAVGSTIGSDDQYRRY
jgi:hypothetical protein